MPGYDKTGPMGQGAMTGWGAGRCGGKTPIFKGGIKARFGGRGCGFGNGRRRGRNVPGLQSQDDLMAEQLEDIRKRLSELENKEV